MRMPVQAFRRPTFRFSMSPPPSPPPPLLLHHPSLNLPFSPASSPASSSSSSSSSSSPLSDVVSLQQKPYKATCNLSKLPPLTLTLTLEQTSKYAQQRHRLPLQPKERLAISSLRCFCFRRVHGRNDENPTTMDDDTVVQEDGKEAESIGKASSGEAEDTAISDRTESSVKNSPDKRRSVFSRTHSSQGRMPDLLTVPGIGPRNLEKLVAKGIGKVSELKQLYMDKFRNNGNDKMIAYLQSSVGILHKHHAISITTYIKDSVEKELRTEESSSSHTSSNRRLTFCIEGNISVGKTTFLHRVTNEAIELRDLVEIVPEPVAKWQDIGPQHFNILDAFYAEPQRYAYTFQNYVFITRLMQEQESSGGMKPLRLMERSVFTDRMVFVRAVHEAKWMNEMEISVYDSWFNPVVSALPGLVPDGFIYLRASPDTCHRRMLMRKRPEEQSVTIDYLRDLHEKHEQWLFPSSSKVGGNLSLSQPSQLIEPIPETLRDRVFYLEGDHVHSSLQKVPALILDCDTNIDFVKDVDAKAAYAKQVSEYFEYVKRLKSLEVKVDASSQDTNAKSLFMPGSSNLFMPNGSLMCAEAMKAKFDLRQQASGFSK